MSYIFLNSWHICCYPFKMGVLPTVVLSLCGYISDLMFFYWFCWIIHTLGYQATTEIIMNLLPIPSGHSTPFWKKIRPEKKKLGLYGLWSLWYQSWILMNPWRDESMTTNIWKSYMWTAVVKKWMWMWST